MTRTKAKPKPIGRHNLEGSHAPAAGYAVLPASRHNSRHAVGIVSVPDAGDNPDGKARSRVLCRLDFLDRERAQDLIDEAQFQTGRAIGRAFDRQERISGGGQWREGDRVDAATAHETAIEAGMICAQAVNELMDEIRDMVGRDLAKIVFRILRDGWNYEHVANERLMFGARGKAEIALRFRIALDIIADKKAAHGKERAS